MSERVGRYAGLGAILVALAGVAGIFWHAHALAGSYDWRYFETTMEAARRSVAWFGQVPLYNPWMCGGEPQLANPQSVAGSPAFLLVVVFGTALGAKLMLLAFVAAGLDGTFRLGRALGLDQAGAAAAALAFGLSGWVVQHFAIGHVSFFGATLIPHALYFYLRGREDLRYAALAGGVVAIIVAQGGTSTAAMAAFALGGVALVEACVERSLRPLGVLALAGLAALALGAYRLLPALQFAFDHPRHVTESDTQSPLNLLRAAFWWRGPSGVIPGHRYGAHEYLWRLPLLAWPLLILGLPLRGRLRRVALLLALVGAGIALGDFPRFGPWWLMRHLPVLRDLRVPSRYVMLTALGCSLLCGAGATRLSSKMGRRTALVTALILCGLALDGVIYANSQLWTAFGVRLPKADAGAAFFQVKANYRQMLDLVLQNRGVIGCDEEAPLTRALALDEGERPQARLEDPGAGTLASVRWTPNAIAVDVALDRPAVLLANLNWNEHWTSSAGEVVRSGPKWPADKDGGRLGVKLPAMRGTVVLRYRPRSFVVGAWVSALSLLALLIAFVRRRR